MNYGKAHCPPHVEGSDIKCHRCCVIVCLHSMISKIHSPTAGSVIPDYGQFYLYWSIGVMSKDPHKLLAFSSFCTFMLIGTVVVLLLTSDLLTLSSSLGKYRYDYGISTGSHRTKGTHDINLFCYSIHQVSLLHDTQTFYGVFTHSQSIHDTTTIHHSPHPSFGTTFWRLHSALTVGLSLHLGILNISRPFLLFVLFSFVFTYRFNCRANNKVTAAAV